MKKKLYILIIFSLVFSQYDWAENGVPVRQGIHIEWQRTGDTGNDGEIIFAWSDTRFGGRDIYAQKIDADGNDLWGSEGVQIVLDPGRQEDPILVSDDNGGAYIIWVDYRNEPENGDIYAQHINSNGLISWDIQGVPLTTVPGKQVAPNMSKDGLGGAFVIWNDRSASPLGHIYGTHLTTNSNDIIAQGVGVPLISSNSNHSGVSIEVAQAGSAIMVWADDKNFDDTDLDIYTQRIDIDCNTLWSTPEEGGIPICNFPNIQQYAKVTYYNEEVSVVVWEDRRNNPNAGDVYGQFISMDGSLTDTEGFLICDEPSPQIKPRVKASPYGAHVVWEDKRNGISDIYAQFITVENGVEWTEGEIAVCSASGAQDQPRLTIDSSGGVYYVWMDERYNSFPETEIFLQHLDVSGNSSFEENGISVSSAPQYQFNPLVRSDGDAGALVVWGDMRSGSIGLYAQHLSSANQQISFEVDGREFYFGIAGNGLSVKSIYLGNNESLLYWEDHRLGVIADLTYGQKIYSGWENIQDPNGIKLSNNSYQTNPLVETLGDNLFLGFGQALGDVNLFYQLLNNDLSMIGDNNGSPVYETPTPQSNYDLYYASDNYLYVAYSDMRNFIDSDIYIQKYSEEGVSQYDPLLPDLLVVDNFLADDNIKFITELNNSQLLIGFDSGNIFGTRSMVLSIDNDESLTHTWEDQVGESIGKRISSYESDQFIKGYAKSDNKILIIWKDRRSGNADVYGQVLDFDGNVLLGPAGLAIGYGDNDQQNPTITYNEIESEFMVCWEDYNGIDFNILCRIINEQSLELSDIIIVCDDGSNQKSPDVHSTLDGSYIFAWEDSRGSVVTSDIYFQLMQNGIFVYDQDGIVLCDADFNQKKPQIDLYNEDENSYIIYWDDLRSSGKEDLTNIYVQSVTVGLNDCYADMGDITGDGIINVLDVVAIVNYVLGLVEIADTCATDFTGDGIINVLDIVGIVNCVLGIGICEYE